MHKAIKGDVILKKRLCIILLVTLLCCLLFGCGSPKKAEEIKLFASETDFKRTVQDHLWIDHITDDSSAIYYICDFDETTCKEYRFTYSPGTTLKDMFVQMLEELSNKGSKTEYDDFYDFLSNHPEVEGFTYLYHDIEYDYENSTVKSSSSANWRFILPNMMAYGEDIYLDGDYPGSSSLKELEQSFEEACETFTENRWLQKYSGAASSKDVRYDPYTYIGKTFLISGSADLDDYYNYEYRNMESGYFCICVTPKGGSYSDQWYIYAERSKYKELYEELKQGNISNITIACHARFPRATSNSMASLMDYFF